MKNFTNLKLMAFTLFSGMAFCAAAQPAVVSVYPSTAEPIDYIDANDIRVTVNGEVSHGTVFISYADKEVELEFPVVNTNGPSDAQFLQIGGLSYPDYMELLKNIADSGVETFTVTVNELKVDGELVTANETGQDGVSVDNGTVVLTYPIEKMPEYLSEDSVWPATFYSYWAPGNPDAVATLVFSNDVESVSNVTVLMGNIEAGSETGVDSYYDIKSENIKIDGPKVYIDFAGESYMGSSSVVTVKVSGVVCTNGLKAVMSSESSGALYQHIKYLSEEAPEAPSAVNILQKERETLEIYNLNGVKLDQNNLKEGIYIINGKKVILK